MFSICQFLGLEWGCKVIILHSGEYNAWHRVGPHYTSYITILSFILIPLLQNSNAHSIFFPLNMDSLCMFSGAQLLSLEGVWVGLNLKFCLVTESKVMREIFVLELLVVGQHLSSSLLWSHLENSPPLCSSVRAFQQGVASSEKAGQPHQSDTSPCLWLQDSL